MVSCIQFRFNSKYLFCVIIYPFFYCLREWMYTQIIENRNNDNKKDKSNPIFFSLIMFLGELSCVLFSIIERYKGKPEFIQKEKKEQKEYERSRCLEFLLLLIIVSIDISVYTIINAIIEDQFKDYQTLTPIVKMIEIIILGIISSQILNNPLHRHQIICIILFIIIILVSIIIEGFILKQNNSFSITDFLVLVVIGICLFSISSFEIIFE